MHPTPHQQPPTSPAPSQPEKEKDGDTEARQLTAIFRPDDAGEWKEKLRLSHEASEQARLARESQAEEDEEGKDDDGEVDDDEHSVGGEGEGAKVWKAKRSLRKLVV